MARSWRFRMGLVGTLLIGGLIFAGAEHGCSRYSASAEYQRARTRYNACGGPSKYVSMKPPGLPPDRDATARYLKALALEPSEYVDGERPETLAREAAEDPKLLEIDREDLSDEAWKEIEARIRQGSTQIELLIRAAASGDVVYPNRYENGWGMLMPHIRIMIRAGKLLYWDVRCRLKNGVDGGVWERIDAIFGLADSVAAEPMLVSQLVRQILMETGLSALEEALGNAGPPPPSWREKLEKRLDPSRLRNEMRRACVFELAMTYDTVTGTFNGDVTSTELNRDLKGITKWLSKPEAWRGAARCFDRLLRLRAALDLPVDAMIPKVEAVENEFRTDPVSFSFLVAAYPKIWRQHSSAVARVVFALEAVKLRSRHADLRSLPESVSDLQEDPLFGRALRYRRTEKGFVLELAAEPEELETPWGIQKPLTWQCPR